MPSKRSVLFGIGFLISAIIIFLVLYYSNFGSVVEYMAGANVGFLLMVFYFVITMLLVKALRWFVILRSAGIRVSIGSAFISFFSGTLVSVFTPGRIGEPVRVYFLKRASGQDMSRTLSPLFMERTLDFLVFLLFIALGLAFFAVFFTQQVIIFSILAMVFGILVIIVLAMVLKRRVGTFFINRLSRRMKFLRKIDMDMFYDTMKKIRWSSVFGFFLITLVAWVMESGILFFALLSVGVYLPIHICIFILSTAGLIGLLSFLPGSLGSFEASAVVLTLVFVSSVPVPAITGGVFLYSILSYLMIIAVGLSSLFFLRRKRL